MSISDFLDTLDSDQLQHCAERIKERLKAIAEEEKRVIWQVAGRFEIYEYFAEEDYLKAVEFLYAHAKLIHQERSKAHEKTISLGYSLHPESEYRDFGFTS